MPRSGHLVSEHHQGEFPPGAGAHAQEFEAIKAQVDEQALPYIQAYALTWAAPYRVECMSITSAFAFGFDPALLRRGLQADAAQPLLQFAQHPDRSYQLEMRPTMAHRRHVVRGGQGADRPRRGRGRLIAARHRLSALDHGHGAQCAQPSYPLVERCSGAACGAPTGSGCAEPDANDVLFYFTGKTQVEGWRRCSFVPGAIADHLTSFGGALTDSGQMSALRWLEAGATGSYGTVVEPCNLPQKFPDPAVVIGLICGARR